MDGADRRALFNKPVAGVINVEQDACMTELADSRGSATRCSWLQGDHSLGMQRSRRFRFRRRHRTVDAR